MDIRVEKSQCQKGFSHLNVKNPSWSLQRLPVRHLSACSLCLKVTFCPTSPYLHWTLLNGASVQTWCLHSRGAKSPFAPFTVRDSISRSKVAASIKPSYLFRYVSLFTLISLFLQRLKKINANFKEIPFLINMLVNVGINYYYIITISDH